MKKIKLLSIISSLFSLITICCGICFGCIDKPKTIDSTFAADSPTVIDTNSYTQHITFNYYSFGSAVSDRASTSTTDYTAEGYLSFDVDFDLYFYQRNPYNVGSYSIDIKNLVIDNFKYNYINVGTNNSTGVVSKTPGGMYVSTEALLCHDFSLTNVSVDDYSASFDIDFSCGVVFASSGALAYIRCDFIVNGFTNFTRIPGPEIRDKLLDLFNNSVNRYDNSYVGDNYIYSYSYGNSYSIGYFNGVKYGYEQGSNDKLNDIYNNPNNYDLYNYEQYSTYGVSQYNAGIEYATDNDLNFYNFLKTLFHAPVDIFKGAVNFSLPLGNGNSLNLLPLMTFLLTLGIALAIVKLVRGGK